MRIVRVEDRDRGQVLGSAVGVADGWWRRLRGLLGRPGLQEGEGLLLTPCRAVHMLGMRFAIDVAFLAGDGRVVAVYDSLPPSGSTKWHREARHALELPAGTLARMGTVAGHRLAWSPVALTTHAVEPTGMGASR